jgi:hypothetical protein
MLLVGYCFGIRLERRLCEEVHLNLAFPFYADFSDQDIADLWAALQTVPPVNAPSRASNMAFPFN